MLRLRPQISADGRHDTTDTSLIKRKIELTDEIFNRKKPSRLELDSAYSDLLQAFSLSIQLNDVKWQNKILKLLAITVNRTARLNTLQQYPLLLAENFQIKGDLFKEAGAWQETGDNSVDFLFERYCYQKAEMLYKNSGHTLEGIGALKAEADNLLRAGRYEAAEDTLNLVLKRYRLAGYKKLFYTYDLLANVNFLKGFPNKTLFYRLAVVKSMEENRDYEFAAVYFHNLALSYGINDPDSSLFYERKSLAFRKDGFYLSYHDIVLDLLALNRPVEALTFLRMAIKNHHALSNYDLALKNVSFGSIFSALKRYQIAEKYFMQATTSFKLEDNKNNFAYDAVTKLNFATLYKSVINFYVLTGQFKKAKYYLGKIPFDINKNLSPAYLITFNLMEFKIDSALGNYVEAIRHYQSYKNLNDSVFSAKNLNTVQELQIQNLTNDKNQSLRVQTSERNIQNMRVQRANLQRNITLAAVGLALIIAGFSYKAYRRKQLSNLLINKKNHQLQLLLKEKDWLLKEVHHRVKNNLHTVFCLLESQTQYLQGEALNAVESSQHRIYAMSLLHQRLYQGKDMQTINMAIYLPELLMYIKESFGQPEQLVFQQVISPIALGIGQAIPLALIVNEAVTNAIKYAFPENQSGVIQIALTAENDQIQLVVEDNGVGMPKDTDFQNLQSLGLELMRGLSADLNGDIQFITDSGTKVMVSFTSGGKNLPN